MNNKKIAKSVIWQFLEKISIQLVGLVVQIVLARILFPEQYGIFAILYIFINIAEIIATSGVGNSLINSATIDESDKSTVFYFSLFVGTSLSIILIFLSKSLEIFFEIDTLSTYLKSLTIVIIISSINVVPLSILRRELNFKNLFYSNSIAVIISGIISILLAYNGFGIWALILHIIIHKLLELILNLLFSKWSPKRIFSIYKLKEHWNYGRNLLYASLIISFYEDLRSFLIGKKYSISDLGYYNKGKQFPNMLSSGLAGSFQSVMFSSLSKVKSNKEKFTEIFIAFQEFSSFIFFPVLIGLFILADPIVRIVLGARWIESIIYVRMFSMIFLTWSIRVVSLQALNALGKSRLYFKIELVQKIVGIGIMLFLLPYSIAAVVMGLLIESVLAIFIVSIPLYKIIKISPMTQLVVVIPYAIFAALMLIPTWIVNYLMPNQVLSLILQIVLSAFLYFSLVFIYKHKFIINVLRKRKELK